MSSEGNVVLLSMDFQRAMCEPDGRVGASGLAAEIARRSTINRVGIALTSFRSRGWPVMHVRVALDASYSRMTSASPRFASFRANDMMLEEAAETQIVAGLEPLPNEPVIDKGCVNPFVGTRLGELLLRRRLNHLVLAGVATNHVVEGTARYAADLGYQVSVAEDLCAGAAPHLHEFSVSEILPAYGVVAPFAQILAGLA